MKNPSPFISVCIPVYQSENYLAQCLRSVLLQDFSDFEVIIVSDASDGKDKEGRTAKKIIKNVQKECAKVRKERGLAPLDVRFYEHSENRGLFETRRTLVYESRGLYITQCDSDDVLEEGALTDFYKTFQDGNTAQEGFSCDIIHGTSTAGSYDENGNFIPSKENRYGSIYYGKLTGREILRGWLLEKKLSSNTWGKLIRREVYLKAFDQIPYTQCNLAEDLLLFFFLAQYAKSYIGIPQKVYRYRLNTGMTAANKITDLKKWQMTCSAASVFGVISSWTDAQISQKTDLAPSQDELTALKKLACSYVVNNLMALKQNVSSELQPAARKMINDYWGPEFIVLAEQQISD